MRALASPSPLAVSRPRGVHLSLLTTAVPDFRSSAGLFRSLKEEHKLKGSGKDLFDASVYRDDSSTTTFHDMVSSMSRMTKDAAPTEFHHMLATIAQEDRLLRLYSQNVDSLDTSLDPLKTCVPLRKDPAGKWPRTVQLHGGLDKMVCTKCHSVFNFAPELFNGSVPPECERCVEINDIRTTHEGKRSHGIGRLRPRMVLYNEHNPDDEAIGTITREDLRKRPDAVIVAGTTLKVPGVRRIVREMCGTVRDRRGGVAVWINNDLPPVSRDLEACFDIVVQGTCDAVAHRAAMRRWHQPVSVVESAPPVSDEHARRAELRAAKVYLPSATSLSALPPSAHPSSSPLNDSFAPPDANSRAGRERLSPVATGDYSPMPRRTSSPLTPLDPVDAAASPTGLPTPPRVHSAVDAASKPRLLATKLGAVVAAGPPATTTTTTKKRPRPAAANQPKPAKPAKPRAKPAPKPKSSSKTSKAQPGAAPAAAKINHMLNFKQAKPAAAKPAAGKPAAAKAPPTPSKLRQVSSAAEAMNPNPNLAGLEEGGCGKGGGG